MVGLWWYVVVFAGGCGFVVCASLCLLSVAVSGALWWHDEGLQHRALHPSQGAGDPVWLAESLGHDTEHRVVTADAGPNLFIVFFGVTDLVELRSGSQHGPSKPHGVSLHVVGDDLHVDGLGL